MVEVAESAAEDGVGDEMVPELADDAGRRGRGSPGCPAEQDLEELISVSGRRGDVVMTLNWLLMLVDRWSFEILAGWLLLSRLGKSLISIDGSAIRSYPSCCIRIKFDHILN